MMCEREWELGEDWQQRGGIYVPATTPKRRRPIAIDLFCGAGGFSLGLIQAGFDVILGADSDPVCAITYTYNLGRYPCQFHFVDDSDREAMEQAIWREIDRETKAAKREKRIAVIPTTGGNAEGRGTIEHFILGDIRKLSGARILEILGLQRGELDCMVGGPPCQGFSRMGRRQVMDPRNSLLFEFARLVCEIHPKTVMMENVPDVLNMVTPEGLSLIDAYCLILEEGGMGTFDALRRSLTSNSGTAATIRGKPAPVNAPGKRQRKKLKEALRPPAPAPSGALDLFGSPEPAAASAASR